MKLSTNEVDEIRAIQEEKGYFYGRKQLAEKYNVSESTIKDVVHYKRDFYK